MYYLNYKELDLDYIYRSTLRSLFSKQNLALQNTYALGLPQIELSFIFNKIVDLNILKLSSHVGFL